MTLPLFPIAVFATLLVALLIAEYRYLTGEYPVIPLPYIAVDEDEDGGRR